MWDCLFSDFDVNKSVIGNIGIKHRNFHNDKNRPNRELCKQKP